MQLPHGMSIEQVEEIATSKRLKAWHGAGVKRWDVTTQYTDADMDEYIPYWVVNGERWTWTSFSCWWEQYKMLQPAIPAPTTPAFQDWVKLQVCADFKAPFLSALGIRSVRTYLKQLSNGRAPERGEELQPHQAVVLMMALLRSGQYIDDPRLPCQTIATRGILAWHSTGSGKTLEGLAVLLAFWNKRTPTGQVWGLLHASTASNQGMTGLRALAAAALRFFPGFRNVVALDVLPEYPFAAGTSLEHAISAFQLRLLRGLDSMATSLRNAFHLHALHRGKEVYTVAKLAHDLQQGLLRLHNVVVVIDEIHLLLRPPPEEEHLQAEYKHLVHALTHQRSSESWVAGLTATPAQSKAALADIMGMVRGQSEAAQPLPECARGYVSYAQLQGDRCHFPALHLELVRVHIDSESAYGAAFLEVATGAQDLRRELAEQFDVQSKQEQLLFRRLEAHARKEQRYRDRLAEWRRRRSLAESQGETYSEAEPAAPAPFDKAEVSWTEDPYWAYHSTAPNKFYKRLLQASSVLLLRNTNAQRFETAVEIHDNGIHPFTAAVSPKVLRAVENIGQQSGKHFVYTAYPVTAMLLAFMLETRLGLRRLATVKGELAIPRGASSQTRYFTVTDKVASTRYLLQPGGRHNLGWNPNKKEIAAGKTIFSSTSNRQGDVVQVIIACKDSYKGVDLRGIRHIHLLESMVDFSKFVQLVGRGPRYCSHTDLPHQDRNVTIHPYWLIVNGARSSSKINVDSYVYTHSLALFDQQSGLQLETDVQEASVDNLVFRDSLHKNVQKFRKQLMSIRA